MNRSRTRKSHEANLGTACQMKLGHEEMEVMLQWR